MKAQLQTLLGSVGEYVRSVFLMQHRKKDEQAVISVTKQIECSYPVTYVKGFANGKVVQKSKECESHASPPRLGERGWRALI